jgi:hypothetical protein
VTREPTDLQNDPSTTTDQVIRFTWTAPTDNGGSPLIDYTVSWDQGTNEYVELATNVASEEYTTTATLTAGTTYNFKVQGRNLVGLSPFSLPVQILAARIPDQPTNLQDVPLVTSAT